MPKQQILEYPWLPYRTRYFDVLYYPVANIAVRYGHSNNWLSGLFVIDSGADITTMNKIVAEMLGISDFESGERIELTAAGGSAIEARIHRVDIAFNGIVVPDVRIAFAKKNELKMSLLGRLDVFDYFDVNLQARTRRTILVH